MARPIDEGRTFTLFYKGEMIAVFFNTAAAAHAWSTYTDISIESFNESFADDDTTALTAGNFTMRGR